MNEVKEPFKGIIESTPTICINEINRLKGKPIAKHEIATFPDYS